MKKKLFYLYLAVLTVTFSCTRDEDPEKKQYPVIYTGSTTGINPEGATLNAEFINLGYDAVIQYGFVYGTEKPTIDSSAIAVINAGAGKGEFFKSINSGLAGNMIYKVKAYAKTRDFIVYGNEIEFLSQGSTYNPWDLILQPTMDGWHDTHGSSVNELGYILFQSEDFYSYNPVSNSVTKLPNIPMNGNTGTMYASFALNNNLFILSNDSEELLKYNTSLNQWTKLEDLPFNIGNKKFFGFTVNNEGACLSGGDFYTYNEVSHAWTKRANLPTVNVHSALVVENRVYAIADYKEIWMYDPQSDVWQKKNVFPGDWHGKVVGFTVNNKIYWGLSYYGGYTGAPQPATDIWEYDPGLNSWKGIERFPTHHSQIELFTFSIGSLSYFGYRYPVVSGSSDEYMIFGFNPGKIK
jgi:hypothetical protein